MEARIKSGWTLKGAKLKNLGKVISIDWQEGNVRRGLTVASALAFLLITLALVLAWSDPMTGYEYSVYFSAPPLFWASVIIGALVGVTVFRTYYGTGNRMWVVGLFQLLLSNVVFMTLYLYKGFIYIQRNDSLSYVGYAKDVVNLGYIPSSNFYPMGSLMMAITGETTGVSVALMSQLFPAVFLTVYTVGMLCWSRSISSNPGYVATMMFASLPLFFAWFVPSLFYQTLCVLMLPFFLFVMWNRDHGDRRFMLLTAMLMMFFVIGHPLVAVGVLLFMVIIFLTERLTHRPLRMMSLPLILFSFVILMGWLSFNSTLVKDLRLDLTQLFGLGEGLSTIGSAQDQASKLGLLPAIQSILACAIDDLIYMMLALWLGIKIWKGGWKEHPMTVIMACFLGGSLFFLAIMAMTFTHNPFRMINLNFVMVFTVPLVAFLLYTYRKEVSVRKHHLLTALVLVCFLLTVFTVYQDPAEGFPNASITTSEVNGNDWLVMEQADQMGIYIIQTNPGRYQDLMYGGEIRAHPDLWRNMTTTTYHFQSFLTSNVTGGTEYLVFAQYDQEAYTRIWAPFDKFTPHDFQGLDLSPAVNHVYTNSDLTVYTRAG